MALSLVQEFFKNALRKEDALEAKQARISRYEKAMDDLLNPMNAPWPSDGQPGDMGERVRAVMSLPPQVRCQLGYEAKITMPDCIQTNLERQQWIEGQAQVGG